MTPMTTQNISKPVLRGMKPLRSLVINFARH